MKVANISTDKLQIEDLIESRDEEAPCISQKTLGIGLFVCFVALTAIFFIIITVEPIHEYPPKVTLTVVGTNDIHGGYYATQLSRKDTGERYEYGGLDVMASLIKTLRAENEGHFLYLDGGDQFQGGLENSDLVSSGEIMADFYNYMALDAGAIGNHEFDFGPGFLQNYYEKLNSEALGANLIDSSQLPNSAQYYPLQDQGTSKIFTFPIGASPHISPNLTELKVGVIGLSTVQTPTKTSGFVDNLFPSTYSFTNYSETVKEKAAALRSEGAHAVILVSHVGNDCGSSTEYGIWNKENMGSMENCDMNDEIFALIDSLQSGTVSAVVQGHRHSNNHFFYKDVAIIGTINGGYYLNALSLNFRVLGTSVSLDMSEAQIQGPIPVCEKIFENYQTCSYVPPQNLEQAGNLVSWEFHGVTVAKDAELEQIIEDKWGTQMAVYQVQICQNFIPYAFGKDYAADSAIGDLITNVLASAVTDQTFDFVVLNGGGFRSFWYPGIIRYAELHSMLPFNNELTYFDITGADLKTLITTLQNGEKKFYPTWGLSQTLQMSATSGQYDLIDLVLSNGSPILDGSTYRVMTIAFLSGGGDDFSTLTGLFSNLYHSGVDMRATVQAKLVEMGEITEQSLEDPEGRQRITILS